ncbi:MAG TPA: type II secretion system protein [Pyrinomonadaceae bacterium]|jgi:prepilin-type N-terminal cleavage/methylation domain-containing protein|nr:type II secretion system protein [Pyrinomonadaceae bacterium]
MSSKEYNLSDRGFTLIEVVISMLIIMILMLGAFGAMTYAIKYNAGNKVRAQAIEVLQQEVERYRAAKFNSTTTDSFPSPADPDVCLESSLRDLRGRSPSKCRVYAFDGYGLTPYTVTSSVDNDPSTPGIQTESYACHSPQGATMPCAIKEIKIEVRPAQPGAGWESVPATAVFRRVRGN